MKQFSLTHQLSKALCGGIFLALYLGLPQHLFAQTTDPALDISMSPPVLYLSVKPGESKQHVISIKNDGTDDVLASLVLSDFRSDNVTGHPIITENTTFGYLKHRDPNLNWKSNFLLKAKAERKIFLDLVVPENAIEGEYPLTILLNTSRIGSSLGSQSQVTGAVGSNLIVLIATDEIDRSKLALDQIKLPKWIDSFRPLTFSLMMKNEGQNAAPLRGNITIINSLGQRVKSYLIYPDMVLAKTSRKARAIDTTESQITDPNTLLAQPDLHLQADITYQPLFLLGIYTIYFDLPQGKVSQTVIGLPIFLLLAIFAIPLLIMTGRYVLIRKKREFV